MERLKRAWNECYPEFRHLTMQCLRDNTGRFIWDKIITNLILVRNRGNDNRPGRENHDVMGENEQTSQKERKVREQDEVLTELFQAEMES